MTAEQQIKQNILANLTFLPDVVNLKSSKPELVFLKSYFFDEETTTEYDLSVEVTVTKQYDASGNGRLEIKSFQIEQIIFLQDRGKTPRFDFKRLELIDYIDF